MERFGDPCDRFAVNSFVYLPCSDVVQARAFYSELLRLDEMYFSSEEGTVGYRIGTMQLAVTEHGGTPTQEAWSTQPGWQGGEAAYPSLGVEVAAEWFAAIVEALEAAGTPSWRAEPQWVGYWSFPVKDPDGHTVEVSAPGRASWPRSAG